MDWQAELKDILPRVTELRHLLHRHPEVSGSEYHTRDTMIARMEALGLEIRRMEGCCSFTATLRNGDGPCVGIRADMDALPVTETNDLPFASENPGVMHACGHDVHMSLAYGSALWLTAHRDRWRGTLRYLFESQEETVGGGKAMVEQGCMENPHVDCVLGQHVNPRYPAGTFYCKPGYVSGAGDTIRLTVTGKCCHGAYPETGVDAIVIAAQVITALQTLVSRTLSPFDPAAITLGTVQGGTASNIVCGEVKLTGTMRTLSPATRKLLKEKMPRLAQGIAEGMGGSAQVEFLPSYSAVYNDDRLYALVEEACGQVIGPENIIRREAPSLGLESVCYFMENTPGVFYDIGSGLSTALHTSTFLVDESALLPGVAMQTASILALLENI